MDVLLGGDAMRRSMSEGVGVRDVTSARSGSIMGASMEGWLKG